MGLLRLPAGWDKGTWSPEPIFPEPTSDMEVILNGLGPALTKTNLFHSCDFTYWTAQKQQQLNGGKTGVAEKEEDFIAVDYARVNRPANRGGAARMRGGKISSVPAPANATRGARGGMPRGRIRIGGKKDKLSSAYVRSGPISSASRWSNRAVMAEYACEIDGDWDLVTETSLQGLWSNPLNLKELKIEDVTWRGNARVYNRSMDRMKRVKLDAVPEYTYVQPGTREDPVLPGLLEEGRVQVAITSQLLTTLMAAFVSRYGWQMVAYKFGDKILFDKSDQSESLDLLTINETGDSNCGVASRAVGIDAAKSSLDLQALVVKDAEVVVEAEGDADFDFRSDYPPNRLYRYRAIEVPPSAQTRGALKKPITIGVRTEIHAAGVSDESGSGGQQVTQYINVYGLNEAKSSTSNWSTNIDRQRATILVTELRNNACKVAKWVYQSLIAGSQVIKLGFITKKQNQNQLLAVQSVQVSQLSSQISLKLPNAWGVVRQILDIILGDSAEEGMYIITRDALNPIVKIHRTEIPEEDEDAEAEKRHANKEEDQQAELSE